RHLIGGVEARERIEDLAVDCLDGALDALAAIASLVAVAELDRLMRAGRRARRHGGAAQGAGLQRDFDLDGGIAAAVQDLAAVDVDNGAHAAPDVDGGTRKGSAAARRRVCKA